MRLPRPRRLILTLALLAWVGIVYWYWEQAVPLKVTAELLATDGWDFAALSSQGLLVLTRYRSPPQEATDDKLFEWAYPVGPIRIYDPIHHQLVTEWGTEADEIFRVRTGARERIALRRNDKFIVADLQSGRSLLNRPASGIESVDISYDGRLAAFRGFNFAIVQSLETSEVLWQRTGVRNVSRCEFSGPELFRCEWIDENTTVEAYLSTVDWRPDDRFRNCIVAQVSPDGQWTITRDDLGNQFLCDGNDGRRKCFLSGATATFSADSESLVLVECDEGRPQITRTNVDDIASSQVDPPEGSHYAIAGEGRFLVAADSPGPVIAPDWMRRGVEMFAAGWDGALLERPRRYIVLGSDGTLYGNVDLAETFGSSGIWQATLQHLCSTGFCVAKPNGDVRFYSFPPSRNWLWLLTWSLAPPATLWLLSSVWRRRRRRHPAVTPPAAVA